MTSHMVRAVAVVALSFVAALVAGCRTAQGTTAEEKRASVLTMRDETLTRLYREQPDAREKIAGAPGYGVFSTIGMKLLIASGNGFGVVRDSASGRDTFMQMQELGLGIGLGVKDTRLVIVFHDARALSTFVDKGWQWAGDADAAAKSGDTGVTAGVGAKLEGGTEVYVLTESGVALQATVTGTKYWKDEELNQP